MRYVLKLEAIGDNQTAYLRHYLKQPDPQPFGHKEMQAFKFGNKSLTPWVSLITGITPRGFFTREFAEGHRDYSQSNSVGSRGIFIYYALKLGIYEINDRVAWKRADRYFCQIVDDSTLIRMSRKEVLRCFQGES